MCSAPRVPGWVPWAGATGRRAQPGSRSPAALHNGSRGAWEPGGWESAARGFAEPPPRGLKGCFWSCWFQGMLTVPGSVIWVLPQGRGQVLGCIPEPARLAAGSVYVPSSKGLSPGRWFPPKVKCGWWHHLPQPPARGGGNFSHCSAFACRSFMARDAPQPLPEA